MNRTQFLNYQAQMKQAVHELSAIPQRYVMGVEPGWQEIGYTQPGPPVFIKRRPEKYTADWDLLPDGTLKPLSERAITMEFKMKDLDHEALRLMYGQPVRQRYPRAW